MCRASVDQGGWEDLVPSYGSLQSYCNRHGFNVYHDYARARIGIITNNENECNSPDSRLGFGTAGHACGQDDGNTVGNECRCGCNRGDRSRRLFGWILMR